MKKSFFILLMLLCAQLSTAALLSLPNVEETQKLAKERNKPAVILWYGSDWTYKAERLCNVWKKFSTNKGFVWGQYDNKTGAKPQKMPIECFNMPVALILAPDGTFMRCLPASLVQGDPKDIIEEFKKTAQIVDKFQELVKQAESSNGTAAANAAGSALDLLPMEDALRCGKLKNIIKKHDPNDSTGYLTLYTIEHMGMYRLINNKLKGGAEGTLKGNERNFAEALAYVNKVLSNKKLKGEILQQWYCGLAYVLKEQVLSSKSEKWQPVLDAYQKAVDVDPTSQYGIGAAKVKRYWDPNAYIEFDRDYYGSGDQNVHMEKEWRVNVTSFIKGKGSYTFSLEPLHNGRMTTRNFRLFINDKEVATCGDTESNTKTAYFDVPKIKRDDKVEVRFLSRCHDGWFGASGHFVMVKKSD